MKKQIILFFSMITVLFACSPAVHVEQTKEVSLSQYKTYAWIKKDSLDRKLELLDRNLKSSGDLYLEKTGMRATDKDPQLLLDYDVLVERTNRERTESVYSQPYFRPFYNPYIRRWGTIYFPSQFMGTQSYPETVTEGTVTITAIDAQNSKTIWQGWSTDILNSRNITAKEIDKIVKGILKKFR